MQEEEEHMYTQIHWEMADMKQKGLASEISQEMVENKQPLHPKPQSPDLSSNQLEQQEMEDDVVIDLENMIQDSKDGLGSCTRCIYRVPPMIRKLKEDAYTPMAVSIGPFHHGDARLQDMEEHKQILFKRFIEEATASLDEMVSFVKQSVPKVCASYSENIKLTEKQLVKLILVDAAFIIELFKSHYDYEIFYDVKLSQPYLLGTIRKDFLLLENQLPFFLIEELFDRAFPPHQRGFLPSFLELTFSFFQFYNKQKLEPEHNTNVKHFTDLLRLFYLPRAQTERSKFKPGDLLLYSANELHEAGVKFESIKSNCLLDLNFSGHVLKIPQIFVEDRTEFLFRNMIALEHCHYPYDSYIVDYSFAMDCLINTNKDVDVLIHRKIIHNWLGDTNEVATLFNGLGKNILTGTCSFEYLKIFKELNKFCQDPCHKMKATLRCDYCNTPWKTVATVAGIIVIILTVTQTIFSILQVALT